MKKIVETMSLKVCIVIFVLLFAVNASYFYENYRSKGNLQFNGFPSNLSCIYDLKIPDAFWSMQGCNNTCLIKEKESLMQIYETLDGRNWAHKWNTTNTSSPFSHCEWYGVLCDFQTKHVISLHLHRNKMKGTFRVNLRSLEYLFGLCFGANNIRGKLHEIVPKFPRFLLRLEFAFNLLTGVIPEDISTQLPFLSKVQLSGSSVTGKLPNCIGDLEDLTVLSVGETKIFGVIPQSMSKLKRLWFLDLEALELDGSFSILYNLTSLEYLHLSSNRIKGEIPEDVGLRYPYLRHMLLQNNLLSGYLPRSIGMLRHLNTLNIARNKFQGPIPLQLGHLNLGVLIISSNLFTSFEQGFSFNYSNLMIFLASNLRAMHCDIQAMVSFLLPSAKTLMQIDISNSNIRGALPDEIFFFKQVTFLKLASNQLAGPLSFPNDNMPYLTLLDLSNNNLTGSIPTAFSRLLMLLELDLRGNKQMKGPIDSSFLIIDNLIRIKERDTDTCPIVRFAHNHGSVLIDSDYYGREYCRCNEHFYGQGGFCYPCMSGGHCPGSEKKNSTVYASKISYVSKLFLKRGYWPFPNENNVRSLQKCPTSIFQYNICVSGQSCDCRTRLFNKNGTDIAIKVNCNKSCLCATGHSGRFCSQCKDGYYKEGIRCFQCPEGSEKSKVFGVIFGSTVAAVGLSLAVFYLSASHIKAAIGLAFVELTLVVALVLSHYLPAFLIQLIVILFALAFNSYLRKCTGLLKTAIFYIQVMDTLVSTTNTWPASIYNVQMYVSSSLNFHFSSLSCPFPKLFTLFSRCLILLILPVICPVLIWLAYLAWEFATKPDKDKAQKFNFDCRKYCLIFIDVIYFPIVRMSMSIIVGCKEIDGISLMKNYVWIDCATQNYLAIKVVAVLQIILFVIGVPAFLYCPLLYYYREKLESDHLSVNNWLSPLTSPYRLKLRPFMEVIMLLRRLLMAVLMASFPLNQPVQTLLILILLVAAIIFQALVKPYQIRRTFSDDENQALGLENIVDILMLTALMAAFTCVGLSVGHQVFSFTSALYVITLIVNCFLVIVFIFAIFYRLLAKSKGSTRDFDVLDIQEPLLNVSDDCYVKQSSQIEEEG